VIDLTRVIEVVTDHDADDVAGWQAVTPIGESVTVRLRIVREGANGSEPPLVTTIAFVLHPVRVAVASPPSRLRQARVNSCSRSSCSTFLETVSGWGSARCGWRVDSD